MSKRLAVATMLAGVRLLSAADGDCLRYEPARVRLNGTLVSHQGLRGFWAVKPDNPICTIKEPSDPSAVAYSGVAEVQLILMGGQADFDRYRPLLGRKVSVSGRLTPQVTGYHQTQVLIIVDGIEAAGESDAPTSAPLRPPPSPVVAVGGYSASVTVVPRPVNRVINQAWDKDPSHFFPDSDRYVDHMFNGPMDIMWVKCRDGYAITGSKSSTGSSVFQMDPADPKNPYWGVAVSDSERTNITVLCSKVDHGEVVERQAPAATAPALDEGRLYAILNTSLGTITAQLYEREAPGAVANFVALTRGIKAAADFSGAMVKRPYFTNLNFHRVIPGFMIQTGDGQRGDGTGNCGFTIKDEIAPGLKFDRPGVLGLARLAARNTGACQFFITDAAYSSLNGEYTIFGQVVEGQEVVGKIARVPKDSNGKPLTPVKLIAITLKRD